MKTKTDQESELYEPCMPEVDERPDIEEIFDQARRAAAGEVAPSGERSGRHVVLVTPGRMIMRQPCPAPGSMPGSQVAPIERMISPQVKRNVAVIAYTELEAVMTDISRTIPFLGLLTGFAYVGHCVWIFEGHSSALAAGCRQADVLIVDGGMVPYLMEDWTVVVSKVMRKAEIYVHERRTFSLCGITQERV